MAPRLQFSDYLASKLKKYGIDRVFGSPGTSEMGLFNSLIKHEIKYYFALHDTIAVGMADGYARASGNIAVVNLHSAQGILNSLGFIRIALRDNVPLLILAGIPSTSYDLYEPNHFVRNIHQSLDLITKWGWSIADASSINDVLVRALSIAQHTPKGPTYLLIPQDIMEGIACRSLDRNARINPIPNQITLPSENVLKNAASAILKSKNPIIIAGFGSQYSVHCIEELSDLITAPVISESLSRGTQIQHVYCRSYHKLFMGYYDSRDRFIREKISKSDMLIFIGCKVMNYKVSGTIPKDATIIHLHESSYEIGKNHRVDISILGNINASMRELILKIGKPNERMKPYYQKEKLIELIKNNKDNIIGDMRRQYNDRSKISGYHLANILNQSIPPNSIIVDDSQSFGYFLKTIYKFSESGSLFGSLASHLGWGLSASLGIKLFQKKRLVVSITGDCGFVYGMQALFASIQFKIPILIIVINNGGSVSLKNELAAKGELGETADRYLSFMKYKINYSQIATSMDIKSKRVLKKNALCGTLINGINYINKYRKPYLIDVVMDDNWVNWKKAWFTIHNHRRKLV